MRVRNNVEVDFFAKVIKSEGMSIREIDNFITGKYLPKKLRDDYICPFTILNELNKENRKC